MGPFALKLVKEHFGSKVVAISDTKGGIFLESGIDYDALLKHKHIFLINFISH